MSMPRRPSGARPCTAAMRGMVERAIARVLAFGRRFEVLDEDRMPARQLRDLGFRDGRDTAARRSRNV